MSPAPDMNRALLRRVQEGDPLALGHLYDRYASMVYGVGVRLTSSEDDAEDITHTVFIGLPLALRSYAARGSFEGWLRRVAVTTGLKVLRSRRRECGLTDAILDSVRSRARGERQIIAGLTIDEALARLPDGLRVAFVLKEVEGYSHREIAEMLDITPGASMTRVCRARTRLQKWLGDGA